MKMKELRKLLDDYTIGGGYSDDAEVVAVRIVVERSCVVLRVNVQDWGTRFEIVITEGN